MLEDIPAQDEVTIEPPDEQGVFGVTFYAFNTTVTMKAYRSDSVAADTSTCQSGGDTAGMTSQGITFDEGSHSVRGGDVSDEIFDVDDDGSGGVDAAAGATASVAAAAGDSRCDGGPGYRDVCEGLVALSRHYERSLSRTLRESDISRLNHAKGEPVVIAPEVAEALIQARAYSEASEGRFDVTMGAVTRLWDFHQGIIPERQAIDQALSHVDWRAVSVTRSTSGKRHYVARLDDPEASVDLGGTAKGFIADKMIDFLRASGVDGAFVNLGGNVAVYGGKPDGMPWRVGIRSPFGGDRLIGVLDRCEGSVVTSGLYERCFDKDGVRYHHILDTATGFPVDTDIAGVTVSARVSADADGYSTTLFALGSKRALRFVAGIVGVEALIVTTDGQLLASGGLEGLTLISQ